MLLREITSSQIRGLTHSKPSKKQKSSDKLFRVTYFIGPSQERSRTMHASSEEAAKKEVSKLGRVHSISRLPSGYGRAVDALRK